MRPRKETYDLEMNLTVVCLSLFCAVVVCLTFLAATRTGTPERRSDEEKPPGHEGPAKTKDT